MSLCPSLPTETLKWLSSLPILMQESFWWCQCSDRYIIYFSSHLHTPLPPISPSLISFMVSVDVKHHVYFTYLLCGQGLKGSGKLSCTWSGGGVRHGRKETRKTASHKKKKKKKYKTKNRQPCRFDLCVSFPSPKHDSDRSSGKRSRVLLHSAASSFRVACQTPKKGRSLRCVVEWSIEVSIWLFLPLFFFSSFFW